MTNLLWILVGIIIGWVIEWVIDWLFWRRGRSQQAIQVEAHDGRQPAELAGLGQKAVPSESDAGRAQAEVDRLQAQLAERDRKLAEAETELERLRARLAETEQTIAAPAPLQEPETRAVPAAGLGPVHKDPLEEIIGIGPVFARRLNEAGVYSFDQLGELTPERVRAIIKPAEWQKIDAESWINQAQVLASPDPLEDIVGIGREYARKLNDAQVYTFAQLAQLTPERVRAIIEPDEWQKIDAAGWIAQAKELVARKAMDAAGGEHEP